MAVTQTSLTQYVKPLSLGAEVVGAAFLKERPAFVLADGTARLGEDAQETVTLHQDGAVLVVQSLNARMVTGGDDGRVMELQADGSVHELADEKGKWIDALALREDGATA